LEGYLGVEARYQLREVTLDGLRSGMILNADVISTDGILMARKGLEVSGLLRSRLEAFAKMERIEPTFKVLVPIAPPQ
jgi:hypothetical protein